MEQHPLVQLAQATSPDLALRILAQHPGLLEPTALIEFRAMARDMRQRGDDSSADLVADVLTLLRRAGQVGTERAVRESFRWRAEIPASVRPIWDDMVSAQAAYAATGDLESLHRALDRGHTLVTHPAVTQSPVPSRVRVLSAYANIAQAASTATFSVQNIEIALSAEAEAIRAFPPGSVEEAVLRVEFSRLYVLRGQLTGALDDIAEGADMAQAFFASIPTDDPDYSPALFDLASVMGARFEVSGELGDLDRQIGLLDEGLTLASSGSPAARQMALANAGHAYSTRFERTDDPHDNGRAIDFLDEALKLGSGAGVIDIRNGLATCLKRRLKSQPSEAEAQRILDLYVGILADAPPSSVGYPGYINNYGHFLLELHRMTGNADFLSEATRSLRGAVDECPPGSPDRPGYQGNLAAALGASARLNRADRHAVAEAVGAYRTAVQAAQSVSRELELDICLGWGQFGADIEQWEVASEGWQRAFAALTALLERQSNRGHKELWLRQVQGLAAAWAYTQVMRDDTLGAIVAMESAQALLLREALSGDAARRAGSSPDLDLATLATISAGRCLLYLAAAPPAGVAVVVRDGRLAARRLPGLNREAADAVVNSVRVSASGRGDFDRDLDAAMVWLSANVVDPLADLLTFPLTIIPVGPLAGLPLHLAGTPAALIELGEVGTAPNARALRTVGRLPATSRVLCVADPRPTEAEPLEGAMAELAYIAQRFGGTFLAQQEASLQPVAAALATADVAHFATHAWADPHTPVNSGILLADSQWLVLADILELRIRAGLIVLSSCESAVAGTVLPDEIVSLPTGFIAAGAATVIGSLWRVADAPTAALMVEMWRRLADGQPPIGALRGAQLWARTVDRSGVQHWLEEHDFPLPVQDLIERWLASYADPRPFGRAQWWGAFTVTGG